MTQPQAAYQPAPRRLAALQALFSDAVTITALPAVVNLELYAGDDFTMRLDVTGPDGEPFDLAGAEADSHIRVTPDDAELSGEFAVTVDGAALLLHLPGDVSAELPASTVWDVEIRLGGQTTTLAGGEIAMTPQVTR